MKTKKKGLSDYTGVNEWVSVWISEWVSELVCERLNDCVSMW